MITLHLLSGRRVPRVPAEAADAVACGRLGRRSRPGSAPTPDGSSHGAFLVSVGSYHHQSPLNAGAESFHHCESSRSVIGTRHGDAHSPADMSSFDYKFAGRRRSRRTGRSGLLPEGRFCRFAVSFWALERQFTLSFPAVCWPDWGRGHRRISTARRATARGGRALWFMRSIRVRSLTPTATARGWAACAGLPRTPATWRPGGTAWESTLSG